MLLIRHVGARHAARGDYKKESTRERTVFIKPGAAT